MIWREYKVEDEAELRAAQAAQCRALRCEFAFPDFGDPRFLWVRVGERQGRAVGAVTAHATLELMFVGGDRALVRDAIRQHDVWAAHLRGLGADEAHAFVPISSVNRMEPLLRRMGFRRSNENYLPFYRNL